MNNYQELWEMIKKKDELLKDTREKLEMTYEEMKKLLEGKYQDVNKLHERINQLIEAEKETTILANNLKNDLARKNTAYLRVTRALHIRSVCEEFEKKLPIVLKPGMHRQAKWKAVLDSPLPECVAIKKRILASGLDEGKVPDIATKLFNKINEDVHGDFRKSNHKLVIVSQYFEADELTLIKCIIDLYGISEVSYQ